MYSCLTCNGNSNNGLSLLVYTGITTNSNNNKTCITTCPTNYTYDSSTLLCTALPISNNTSNTTTNNTTNSTSTSSWKYKIVPNYLFLIISVCTLPIVIISKYQIASTNLQLSLYTIFALFCTASLGEVLYF